MRLRAVPVVLLVLALLLPALGGRAAAGPGSKDRFEVERYPASFRLAVVEAIRAGVEDLKQAQSVQGTWGDPAHTQAMGHTALPLLAILKSRVEGAEKHAARAFRALGRMKLQRVYSVALYLMCLQAKYQPELDTLDTEVGSSRHERLDPEKVRARFTGEDAARMQAGIDYLLKAQNASGLWHYDVPGGESTTNHDLSNSQYALLGLRAAADAGFRIRPRVWQSALHGLLALQDEKGPEVALVEHEVADGYATTTRTRAEQRGFHYKGGRKNGPLGENTLWVQPATGSMTTAGVAGVAICQEGLWRSRRFRGRDRRDAKRSIRDGLAWMQEHFTVTENPGHPRQAHHLYYVYGLERMGMLTNRRWLGSHDWYKEGADLLLAMQDERHGGWGGHVATSFAVLFLKRATRAQDRVVTTR